MEDLLLDLDRYSIGMPLWNWWPVHQAGITMFPIGLTPTVETAAADAKISTGLGDVTGLFCVTQNTKLARDLALILAHEHLLHPGMGSLLEMSREYRHIYTSDATDFADDQNPFDEVLK
jgi:hypothetical protein